MRIYDERNTTTTLSAFRQLGFDLKPIFDAYDKIIKVFQPGSGYSIIHFLKDGFIKPPSLIDAILNDAKITMVDGKVKYETQENIIFGTTIKS